MFAATGATSGIGVEAIGCPELVTGLTRRLRTSDCRPCSSSESSRFTIGICVFGVELVVWIGVDGGVERVRMCEPELCTCDFNLLIVRWSSSFGLGAIPPLDDVEPRIGLF